MRLAVRIVLAFLVNTLALLFAGAVLDGVHIDVTSFLFAAVIFSVASLVLRPLIALAVVRAAPPLIGVIGLVTTFGILLITDLLSDGLDISGAGDWILATVIVWLALVVYEIFDRRLHRVVMRRIRPDAAEPG